MDDPCVEATVTTTQQVGLLRDQKYLGFTREQYKTFRKKEPKNDDIFVTEDGDTLVLEPFTGFHIAGVEVITKRKTSMASHTQTQDKSSDYLEAGQGMALSFESSCTLHIEKRS